MAAKRILNPRAKPGELKAGWGRDGAGASPSVMYAWGGHGASSPDGRMLSGFFEAKRLAHSMNGTVEELSLVEELERRGYDLSTMKFSIQQKLAAPEEGT